VQKRARICDGSINLSGQIGLLQLGHFGKFFQCGSIHICQKRTQILLTDPSRDNTKQPGLNGGVGGAADNLVHRLTETKEFLIHKDDIRRNFFSIRSLECEHASELCHNTAREALHEQFPHLREFPIIRHGLFYFYRIIVFGKIEQSIFKTLSFLKLLGLQHLRRIQFRKIRCIHKVYCNVKFTICKVLLTPLVGSAMETV
jgi:hypothetical protein